MKYLFPSIKKLSLSSIITADAIHRKKEREAIPKANNVREHKSRIKLK